MSESLQESIGNLKAMFHKRMAEFEAELPRSQSTPTTNIVTEFSTFKSFVMDALTSLQRQVELLAHTVDAMEMRGRRKMLLLHGVTEDKQEDTSKVVLDVVQRTLKMKEFSADDIRRCHRMGRPSADHKPRPIILKLDKVMVRDSIWFAKTKLKGSGITVSEFLTKQRHDTFMAAREKFGVTKCWTKQGYIHIMAPDGSRHRVADLRALRDIEQKDTKKPSTAAKHTVKTKRGASQKK